MSGIYTSWKERLLGLFMGAGMPGAATLAAVAVNDSYVFDPLHVDIADIPEESVVAGPISLTGVTFTGNTFDAADVEFESSVIGQVAHAVIVFFVWDVNTQLLAYIDESSNNSLPQNLLTGELSVRWSVFGICRV